MLSLSSVENFNFLTSKKFIFIISEGNLNFKVIMMSQIIALDRSKYIMLADNI